MFVIFSEFGGSISVFEITKFIDGGGNLLLAAGSHIGDSIRELAVSDFCYKNE